MRTEMTKASGAVLAGLTLLLFGLPATATDGVSPPAASTPAAAESVAIVTAVEGVVMRGKDILQPFEKLPAGEAINLSNAKVRLVYLASGRQETWQGSGRIVLGEKESRGSNLAAPLISSLPELLVKQLAKPTTLAAHERAGAVRLRALGNPQAVEAIENNYKQLRAQAAEDDLTPELYRLSALAELKAAAASDLARALDETLQRYPQRPEAKRLKEIYGVTEGK